MKLSQNATVGKIPLQLTRKKIIHSRKLQSCSGAREIVYVSKNQITRNVFSSQGFRKEPEKLPHSSTIYGLTRSARDLFITPKLANGSLDIQNKIIRDKLLAYNKVNKDK